MSLGSGAPPTADLTLQHMTLGRAFEFEATISLEDVDRFAALTGDFSPLHMDDAFARARGFRGRVVHGAFTAGLVSRLIGTQAPGRNCLLHSIGMQFIAPVYPGDRLRIEAVVDQVSEAVESVTLKVHVWDVAESRLVAKAKVTMGFTQSKHAEPAF